MSYKGGPKHIRSSFFENLEMIMVILNPKKRQSKSVLPKYLRPIAFRPTREVGCYMTGMYDKSKFINRAIYFYILMINQPIRILKELKKQHPRLYKFVGRKKFKW